MIDCISAPASPSAAPTTSPRIVRGKRDSITIRCSLLPGVVGKNCIEDRETGMLREPMTSPPTDASTITTMETRTNNPPARPSRTAVALRSGTAQKRPRGHPPNVDTSGLDRLLCTEVVETESCRSHRVDPITLDRRLIRKKRVGRELLLLHVLGPHRDGKQRLHPGLVRQTCFRS